MSDCEKCTEMISCLLDDELSDAEIDFVRGHVAACPECRAVYEAFSAISEQVRAEEELPDGLHERIMSGVNAKQGKKKGIVWIKYLSAAACLALVIFAGAKSGMLNVSVSDMADEKGSGVTETVPILFGWDGDRNDGTQPQCSHKELSVGDENESQKLLMLLEPSDSDAEYTPSGAADYEVSVPNGDEFEQILIYIEGDDVYADCGSGVFLASGSTDEIRALLDAWAGE